LAHDTDKRSDDASRRVVANGEAARPRKPYVAPELIEYGSVAKLTQAGGQTVQDFLFWRRMGMGMCL
jgi:hypothetical protein